MKVKSESEVTQSCPTLSDPMDCSLPGSSILGAGALGQTRGMVRGGRREEGSGWGTRVDIWQNQYNIVKLKNKI